MPQKNNFWIQKACILFLLVTLFFLGCQKETIELTNESSLIKESELQDARQRLKTLMTAKGTMTNLVALKENPKFSHVKVDIAAQSRNKQFGVEVTKILEHVHIHDHYHHLMEMAINPDDFECGPTFLSAYFAERNANLTPDDLSLAEFFSIIPRFEAILEDDTDVDYFGATGEFTTSQRRSFIRLKRFWNMPTNIQLSDMHGAVFNDPATVSQLLLFLGFGFLDEDGTTFTPFTQADADELAGLLQILFGAPVFENYSHPILTFNAFATGGIPELGISPKIVMGDGVLDGYAELGFRTTSDKFILAHEFGHQIQFANGIINNAVAPTPEGTRRTELMADAFASYFSSHGQGVFLQPLAISRYVKTASSVGDCNFDLPSHHGTPNQRARATEFGGKLAERRGLIDQVLSSEEFARLFDEALPQIIISDSE